MKKKAQIDIYNKDGFCSGGFIYNELDKFAQYIVMLKSSSKYDFTAWGFCKYPKQLCIPDFYCGYKWVKKIGRRFLVSVYMKDRNGVKVSWGIFCFCETNKNFCEGINGNKLQKKS